MAKYFTFTVDYDSNCLIFFTKAEKTIDAINNICYFLMDDPAIYYGKYIYYDPIDNSIENITKIRHFFDVCINPFVVCDLIKKSKDFKSNQYEYEELYDLTQDKQAYDTYITAIIKQ